MRLFSVYANAFGRLTTTVMIFSEVTLSVLRLCSRINWHFEHSLKENMCCTCCSLKMVWLESLTNPTLRFTDIEAVARITEKNAVSASINTLKWLSGVSCLLY